jgi:hypothetical protein
MILAASGKLPTKPPTASLPQILPFLPIRSQESYFTTLRIQNLYFIHSGRYRIEILHGAGM